MDERARVIPPRARVAVPNEWDEPPVEADDEDEFGPDDPDYDLSESYGYRWEPKREHWPVPPWLLWAISLLIVVALLAPGIIFVLQHT